MMFQVVVFQMILVIINNQVSISDYVNKFKKNKSDCFQENKISNLVFNQYFSDDDKE
jgi:hypothetical protein